MHLFENELLACIYLSALKSAFLLQKARGGHNRQNYAYFVEIGYEIPLHYKSCESTN